jgi:CTP synthase (UTP-ammonia lyase)
VIKPLSIVTRRRISIGLIGDYDKSAPAHQAIALALHRAAEALHVELGFEWVPTEEIVAATRVAGFSSLWCVPASPYRSMEGALLAIRHARESGVPFLGTCGGFQHAVIEYARNVLGWADAEHTETAPDAARAVISLLECSLVETSGVVRFIPGSRIAAAYGAAEATESYRCRYGLNAEFRSVLLAAPLRATAEDEDGEVRAVELDGHPFFVATLFQPERANLAGKSAPLMVALVSACAA